MKFKTSLYVAFLFFLSQNAIISAAQTFRIVGYYAGTTIPADSFEVEKLTHLIYCFGHLKGNQFALSSATDSATIKRMVELKSRNPEMKVMLSLGGWGGCEKCSEVFSTEAGRKEFASSVRRVSDFFQTDGIDIDWEYPAIQGFPGHPFKNEDRKNFTELLKEVRNAAREGFEISFAAGGFTSYIDSSAAWNDISDIVDFINVMTYDLVHGYSKVSGHHTPLYSTPQQTESTDHAVKMLLNAGVPAEKIVIGAAFYGRFFKIDDGDEAGLYQPCTFMHSFSWKYQADSLVGNGFERKWDDVAHAPYSVNRQKKILATYDDELSVSEKTKYAKDHKLGGIMFWQLYDDRFHRGLLNVIYETARHLKK